MFSLSDLIQAERQQLVAFEARWQEAHRINAEQFPLMLPKGQEGLWHEMFQDFDADRPFDFPDPSSAPPAPASSEGMSLANFVKDHQANLEAFERYWLNNHQRNPQHYPLSLPDDQAGQWWEMLQDFDPDKPTYQTSETDSHTTAATKRARPKRTR